MNPQIPPDSSYLLTKILVRNPEVKQVFNTNVVIIDIMRQGNIDQAEICTIEVMILEVKSLDKAPIWITLNDIKCKQFLYETDWAKWKAPVLEKIKHEHSASI